MLRLCYFFAVALLFSDSVVVEIAQCVVAVVAVSLVDQEVALGAAVVVFPILLDVHIDFEGETSPTVEIAFVVVVIEADFDVVVQEDTFQTVDFAVVTATDDEYAAFVGIDVAVVDSVQLEGFDEKLVDVSSLSDPYSSTLTDVWLWLVMVQ